jgi:hypothetical protein
MEPMIPGVAGRGERTSEAAIGGVADPATDVESALVGAVVEVAPACS